MSDKSAAFEVIREDDYVEYFLFPKLNETDSEGAEQNGLNDVLNEVTRIVGQFCANYIWHKDAFHVRAIHRNMNLLNSLGKLNALSFQSVFRLILTKTGLLQILKSHICTELLTMERIFKMNGSLLVYCTS